MPNRNNGLGELVFAKQCHAKEEHPAYIVENHPRKKGQTLVQWATTNVREEVPSENVRSLEDGRRGRRGRAPTAPVLALPALTKATKKKNPAPKDAPAKATKVAKKKNPAATHAPAKAAKGKKQGNAEANMKAPTMPMIDDVSAAFTIIFLPFALVLIRSRAMRMAPTSMDVMVESIGMPPVEAMLECIGPPLVLAAVAYVSIVMTICFFSKTSFLALKGATGAFAGAFVSFVLVKHTGMEELGGLAVLVMIPGFTFMALKLAVGRMAGDLDDANRLPFAGAIAVLFGFFAVSILFGTSV